MKKSKIITNGNVNLERLVLVPRIDWDRVKDVVIKKSDEYWEEVFENPVPMIVLGFIKDEVERQLSNKKTINLP
jgi:hypothetical protein